MEAAAISEEIQAIFDQRTRITCGCRWPNPEFEKTLSQFTWVRIQIHRLNKLRKQGHMLPYALLYDEATLLRHRLERLAPCRECIEKYNPTGRKRNKIWNPARERAYREALQ